MRSFMSLSVMVIVSFVAYSSGQEQGKPRPKSLTGVLSKFDGRSLTVTQRGDSGERMTTFAVGDQTKILRQTNEDVSVPGEGGRERKTPKTEAAKTADLKADQRVTVGFIEDGKADSVLILRVTPRKGEGEK